MPSPYETSHILYVADKDDLKGRILVERLRNAGEEVKITHTGAEAIDHLASYEDSISLLLASPQTLHTEGYRAIRMAFDAGIPTLGISLPAHQIFDEETASHKEAQLKRAGAQAIVRPPFHFSKLDDLILRHKRDVEMK